MTVPQAAKRPHPLTIHNDTRIDNYYWLRDDRRTDPDVLAYLQQENQYSREVMAPYDALKQSLYDEMVNRIPSEDMSVPYVKNGYRYQSRYEPGKEYPIYLRQPESETDKWQTMLDGNQRAENHEFYSLGALAVSPDNQVLALAEDFLSRRQYDIRFRDLNSDAWLPDVIEKVSSGAEWSADSAVLYYVRKHPQTLLPYQVYRHRLGSHPSSDELVYEEQDDTYYVSLGKTTSERYITIYLSSTTTTEVLLIDATRDDAAPQVFIPRRKEHEYGVDHYRGMFYLRSNREGKNFGLYCTPDRGESNLETLIAPREQRVLESFELFRDWLVVEERERGLTSLRQIHWQTQAEKNITFNDASYVTWLSYNPSPETSLLRYGYASMTTPSSLYELNMDTGQQQLLKQAEVKNFTADDYCSERLWITARDGVEVPVSLVYHRKHFKPGRNPILVYGYGAYGSSMDPDFSVSRLSLLDRGFVFALTHIRGGGELGQQWYDDGRLLNKMHSFTDFIDVSNALAEKGYGDRRKMFAMGGSAGGLLMGAVVNFAPDLFKGVVAQVPFVDVLTTMLDESIPLTTGEYDEWGDPNDRQYYDYIKQYSPYDGVTEQAYPHLLVTTGLHDSQVQYWEPAKWVAKLREMKTDQRLLLLYTDMDAGHGGKSGRFKHYEDIALEYAFLLMVLESD
ncbi:MULTISPECIES: S9 family peptidase [unclassified Brenneria]|uniref:S9 family peptidase n=1 Tax=unclassified Brenneria TaxID=2634434 RepID=UPI0015530401|nr:MULTISPECIES: prolyl oligopeptidase family serine peptidase [unclassified Brenneria]MBJ7220616.1 prolyl oligopeptidase family serine peptidase [Brenneria sp. L3-3C-1]MEE3641859.1 prolyl oligopeptidase family serine peptidase [Brenneria sp. L3_3C_1]MEE3649510.1 prolyl oligopeptidase family serine peptidase [Brenneria sp. HEZEL_4_2_4]NPC99467.1 prolyl oligopeptidase family serine peptidase [Brenneria sp. hezel4-2-4]